MNLFILLQAQQPGGNPLTSFLPLILIILVFYLFMIRPQMKRQKELKNYRSQLSKGDKIVTTGGIYGKVTDVKEQSVTVEISDNVRVKIDKNAVLRDTSDLGAQQK